VADLRILQFVQGYEPAIGGTEYLIKSVSERLAQTYGDDVNIITTNGYNCEVFNTFGQKTMAPGDEVIDGVHVKRLPVFNKLAPVLNVAQKILYRLKLPGNSWARDLYSGPILPKVLPVILRARADVVCASSFPLMQMHYAASIKRIKKIPLVLQGGLHPNDLWGFNRKTIYKLIRYADAYIAYTKYEKDFLINKGIEADKIKVIGLGTDPALFAGVDGGPIKEKYDLNGSPVVTFIGQQGGHKGIDSLISAMVLVWKKIPEARLIIAGAPTNYSPHIKNMINALDELVRGRVILIDNFSEQEKAKILAAADVFASPSGFESFGITYLEAWAAKKPVIGCRSGAVPTVINEYKDGLLVDYGDYGELAGAILELLFDPETRKRLGENGYENLINNYTWDIVTAKFRQVYLDVKSNKMGSNLHS